MENLYGKIFDDVMVNEKETRKCCKAADGEIFRIMDKFKNRFDEDELEELKDDLFSVSLAAEKAGFELGVKFLFRLMNS